MRPTECIWCGLELLDDTTHDTIFACGTVRHPRSDRWSQSTGCKEIMRSREQIQRADQDMEIVKAREANAVTALQSHTRTLESRIQRAIEAIRAANRYYLLGEVALIPDETGNLTQACVLDDVAAILEGKSNDETK